MLDTKELTNKIISDIDQHVQSCYETKDDEQVFNPDKFDKSCYLKAIYDYIIDKAEITGIYSGVLPVGTPDPLSGSYTFNLINTGNSPLVINAQSLVTEFPPTSWWTALITSLLSTASPASSNAIVTVTGTPTHQAISTKVWTDLDFNGKETKEDIWEVYASEIITAIKGGTFVTPSLPAVSTGGGTGTVTFNLIK